MGFQDRDYMRSPRRGLASLGGFSVNTWIIVVNVAVFVVGLAMSKTGVPVFMGMATPWSEVPPPSRIAIAPGFQEQPGGADVGSFAGRGAVVRTVVDASTGHVINFGVYRIMDPLTAYGHFSTNKILGSEREDRRWRLDLQVWRLITFQFLHAGVAHLAFNMLGLYFFGGIVEQQLGSRRYLAFYLVCGIFGGIGYLVLNGLGVAAGAMGASRVPFLLIQDPGMPLVGASAGVFGVIMACAYIAPDLRVQLIFPPIPMRLKTMAYAYVVIAAANLFLGGRNAGGDAAHLGGAIAGFFFIRNAHLLRDFFDVWSDSRRPRARRPALRLATPEPETGDPMEREVDRILDKVRAFGSESLSESEKQTLRRATARRQASGD